MAFLIHTIASAECLIDTICGHFSRRDEKNEYADAWKKDEEGGVISDQPRITVGDPHAIGPTGGYVTK